METTSLAEDKVIKIGHLSLHYLDRVKNKTREVMEKLPVPSKSGIEVMSIKLLLPNEDEAVIWRGPLIGNTPDTLLTQAGALLPANVVETTLNLLL